jgi:hypothetical protein
MPEKWRKVSDAFRPSAAVIPASHTQTKLISATELQFVCDRSKDPAHIRHLATALQQTLHDGHLLPVRSDGPAVPILTCHTQTSVISVIGSLFVWDAQP